MHTYSYSAYGVATRLWKATKHNSLCFDMLQMQQALHDYLIAEATVDIACFQDAYQLLSEVLYNLKRGQVKCNFDVSFCCKLHSTLKEVLAVQAVATQQQPLGSFEVFNAEVVCR